ncbi:MAG: transposase [Bryobacteraceae bacterium]
MVHASPNPRCHAGRTDWRQVAWRCRSREAFIGGKARNMHSEKRRHAIRGRGPEGKAIVAAALDRGSRMRATVVEKRRKYQLHSLVKSNVEARSNLYSDDLRSYDG